MKKLISIVMLLFTVISVAAQSSQLATLLHQGEVSVFYGSSALKQAVSAAEDGDVITLSAGQFDGVDIYNELTIRGAGMGIENLLGYTIPTVVNNGFNIQVECKFEGIKFTAGSTTCVRSYKSSYFEKCELKKLASSDSSTGFLTLVNCVITETHDIGGLELVATNCVFNDTPAHRGTSGTTPKTPTANYTNCIFTNGYGYSGLTMCNVNLTNCIFNVQSSSSSFGYYGSSALYNTLLIGNNGGTTSTSYSTCIQRSDLSIDDVFVDDTFYNLKDEFKSFVTSDGKEVGIYGGSLGFSQTPNNPQITKFTVAPKTSADGKLSVEIEVEGIE